MRDVLHLGNLVVVGEDDRAALGGQLAHLGLERDDLLRREGHLRGLLGNHWQGWRHRQVHGKTSRMRDRSSAGAEWVSAPIETHSTPVSARALSVSSVTPPLASSCARPATCATAARSWASSMLSSSR